VLLNGKRTTYGENYYYNYIDEGYTAVANISGTFTEALKPNVPSTIGGVTTTMRVVDYDCSTVVVEWEVVNSKTEAVTVGVCVRANTLVVDDQETWIPLPDMHGMYSKNAPFYIQAEEPFSGIYAGYSYYSNSY
jgi:hypothetical protein